MNINYVIMVVLASAGVAGLATDVNLNVDAFRNADPSVKIGIAAVAIIGCILGIFSSHLLKQNTILGLSALITCVVCAAFSLAVSIERIGVSKDNRVHAEVEHNTRYERLEKRVADLTAQRNAEAALGGCGRLCRQWQDKLDKAQAELATIGAPVQIDQSSVRIASYLPGVSPEAVANGVPVIGALGLSLGYNICLIAAGFAGGSRPRVINVTPRRRRQLTRYEQVQMYMLDFAQKNDGAVPSFADVRDGLNLPDATASHYRQKVLRQA
jgi:hypothetical protein